MNDDMRDEVPVPHYEDELWRTLARAHAEQRSDGRPAPGPPAGGPVGPPVGGALRQRRRARRRLLVGVGSIAAAGLAVAAIVAGGSEPSPDAPDTEAADGPGSADETTPSTETPEMSLAAQITAAEEEASASSLIHSITDNQYDASSTGTPVGDSESWTDEQSGARRDLGYNAAGEPSFDTGRAVAPAVDDPGPPPLPPDATPFDPSLPQERLRQVDYCFSEYREYDQTAIPGHNEAERIGEWLAEGELVEDGTEVMNGRELIRLVQVPADSSGPNLDGAYIDESGALVTLPPSTTTTSAPLDPDTFEYVEHIYLVDAETFRPVHVIGYPGEEPDHSDAMYIETIEYLPRTPENLANLAAPVPDGFTLVPELRGDGARFDACGG